ncbi:MAG TPA: hypothetical protein V6D10_05740 [Trichocoleus sp.]|jgi:hypothetical protein
MNPELAVGILGFIIFSMPIVGGLWKIFTVREALKDAIKDVRNALIKDITANAHRIDLLEIKNEHMIDQQTLALKGTEELAQHVRTRSQRAEDELDRRMGDVERFLEKTTTFTCRSPKT